MGLWIQKAHDDQDSGKEPIYYLNYIRLKVYIPSDLHITISTQILCSTFPKTFRYLYYLQLNSIYTYLNR